MLITKERHYSQNFWLPIRSPKPHSSLLLFTSSSTQVPHLCTPAHNKSRLYTFLKSHTYTPPPFFLCSPWFAQSPFSAPYKLPSSPSSIYHKCLWSPFLHHKSLISLSSAPHSFKIPFLYTTNLPGVLHTIHFQPGCLCKMSKMPKNVYKGAGGSSLPFNYT